MEDIITKRQREIYKDLYSKNKGTPMAVSSESLAHIEMRFKMIAEIFHNDENIDVHDVGMGLGDFYEFVKRKYPQKEINYSGTEILKEFVDECKIKYPESNFYLRDIAEKSFDDTYDYVVMSGVFHQRRDIIIRDWEYFSQKIIQNSFYMCNKGIAFNFISPFVDFYQTDVYYCNLSKLLNFINDKLSRFFEIRHSYALYEFTVYVFKEEHIKNKYHQPEFNKYFK